MFAVGFAGGQVKKWQQGRILLEGWSLVCMEMPLHTLYNSSSSKSSVPEYESGDGMIVDFLNLTISMSADM